MSESKVINKAKFTGLLTWLTCLIRIRYHFQRNLFSNRELFMRELAPKLPHISQTAKLAWPSALFFVTHSDINRALKSLKK